AIILLILYGPGAERRFWDSGDQTGQPGSGAEEKADDRPPTPQLPPRSAEKVEVADAGPPTPQLPPRSADKLETANAGDAGPPTPPLLPPAPLPQPVFVSELPLPNGSEYTGWALDGVPEGKGSLTNSGGVKFEGQFHNGKLNGIITTTLRNGRSFTAVWQNDNPAMSPIGTLESVSQQYGYIVFSTQAQLEEGEPVFMKTSDGHIMVFRVEKRDGSSVSATPLSELPPVTSGMLID